MTNTKNRNYAFRISEKDLMRIKEKAAKGTPIVLITLKISDTTYKELQSAQKYVLIESAKDNKSKVHIKKDNQIHEYIIDGEYWQLNKFMEEVI